MSPEKRMPPSAMTGTSCGVGGARALHDRGDHRHADAGDDARRADRAGADADLHRVDAGVDQRLRALGGRDVAGDQVDVGETAGGSRADHVEHALRVAVGGVDDQHVDVGGDQRLGPLHRVLRDADGRAAAQPAERVLRRVRVLDRLLDVLDGDQALQPEVAVDDEQLLDLVLVEDLARRVERRADRDGDQVARASSRRRSAGCTLVSNRRSRLVRMPTSRPSLLPSSVIGTPEMRYFFISSSAS